MGKKITLELDVDTIARITSNHGGFYGGECIACDASGWLEPRHGYPHGSKEGMGNQVHHKPDCPMNAHLNDDGSLRE